MEILKTSFSREQMIEVPSGVERGFRTYQILNFFLRIAVQVDEVRQETEHGCLLLSFFRETVDQFDDFLDEWMEVVG